ncbi:hypothetical protein JYU34_013549 [Plutella xylostella]|uniref:Uncharacterized protein n=1 Tax=Plutella xylostella TaxID=51655 RepID=A0ABQ7QBD1_PLUXY|nr:hypothetical protein JYU34_013549 [Plutella xylostella]
MADRVGFRRSLVNSWGCGAARKRAAAQCCGACALRPLRPRRDTKRSRVHREPRALATPSSSTHVPNKICDNWVHCNKR